MQHLEVSRAVRRIYKSLGFKGLRMRRMVVTDVSGPGCPETPETTILRCVTSPEKRVFHSTRCSDYDAPKVGVPRLCQDLGGMFQRSDNPVHVPEVYS